MAGHYFPYWARTAAANAATIDERLEGGFDPVDGVESRALAEKRVAAWCRAACKGDERRFAAWLERRGVVLYQ